MTDHRVRRTAVLCVAALLVWSCSGCAGLRKHEIGGIEYKGQTQFTPPQYYQEWWVEASMCSGTAGVPFGSVEWFLVDELDREVEHERIGVSTIAGFYSADRVFLRRGQQFNKIVVKHEMLHALGFTHNHALLWVCSRR